LSASDPRERARAHLRRTDGFADFDFAVVDAGPGIEAALRATIRCSRLLAVAVPEPASLYSAYALIKTVVSQVPHLPIDLLVNRVTATEEGDRAFEILDSASRSFLDRSLTCRGAIPERAEIRRAVQSPGRLLTLANPEIAGVVDSLMSEEADLDGDDQATAGCSSPEAETSCPL
jgi:MinD-like ATPase involved in chromosome partitioning or flagellar assembly